MKVIIAGTRYKDQEKKIAFDDYNLVVETIKNSGFEITSVICGKAIGVDSLGERWATANDVDVISKPANWNRDGKAAGAIRNREMAEMADAAVVVWDGVSPGTRNMIDEMIRLKKPYYLQLTRSTVLDFI